MRDLNPSIYVTPTLSNNFVCKYDQYQSFPKPLCGTGNLRIDKLHLKRFCRNILPVHLRHYPSYTMLRTPILLYFFWMIKVWDKRTKILSVLSSMVDKDFTCYNNGSPWSTHSTRTWDLRPVQGVAIMVVVFT